MLLPPADSVPSIPTCQRYSAANPSSISRAQIVSSIACSSRRRGVSSRRATRVQRGSPRCQADNVRNSSSASVPSNLARRTQGATGTLVGTYEVQSIEVGRVTVLGPGGPQVLGPSFDDTPPARRPGGAPDLSGLLGLPGLLPAAPGAPAADPGLSIPGLRR